MDNNLSEKQKLAKKELIEYGFGNQDSELICLSFRNPNERDYVNAIRENNAFLEQLGFSKEEVIRFAKSLFSFYDLDKDYIQGKIDEIISLGVSKEEAIQLCKTTRIFGTAGSSKEHMDDVISLGYSKDDALGMLKRDYELYLRLAALKRHFINLIDKLFQLGFEENEILDMFEKREINCLCLHEYESALEHMDIAKNAFEELLAKGSTKSEALNKYRIIYHAVKHQEAQRVYEKDLVEENLEKLKYKLSLLI